MRILVSGASGFIGRHLLARLRAEGHEVVALVRAGGAAPPGAEIVHAPADLATIDGSTAWPEGIEAVVHLAALNPSRTDRTSQDAAALGRVNAAGIEALARAAAQAGIRRVLFLSTALVHGVGRAIREADAPAPQNPYAASKLEGERRLRAALDGTATAFTILRPPPVYGPGGRGSLSALRRLAGSPLPLPLAGTGHRRSVLAVGNAVDAIALALSHPAAANETFLLADDEPRPLGELVRLMRAARGRPPRLLPAPFGLADRLVPPFTVDDGKIRHRLGWHPPLSTPDALRAWAEAENDRRLEDPRPSR